LLFLDVTIGYINVVVHKDFKLNEGPIEYITLSTEDECISECMDPTRQWPCSSMNVVKINADTISCHIHYKDRFRSIENFIPVTGTNHISFQVRSINRYCLNVNSARGGFKVRQTPV